MSQIIELAVTLLLPALLALLVVAKSDKQSVHVLEGKLFKRGIAINSAGDSYRKHVRKSSVIAWVLGFVAVAFGISSIELEDGVQFLISIVGVVLVMFGVIGRLNTFHAAEKDLELR